MKNRAKLHIFLQSNKKNKIFHNSRKKDIKNWMKNER